MCVCEENDDIILMRWVQKVANYLPVDREKNFLKI